VSGARAVAVVGPTAAGKSDLAVGLALALGGEVVNADSMQVYRGMDIGTAKLTVEERRGVPHHLLDLWDCTRSVSVAEFQGLARAAIADVQDRGRVPVLAGGSGLYVRAVLDDLEFPGTDPVLRAGLERRLAEEGAATLHAELAARDPEAAAAILPTNGRRIVRALEVVTLTGSFRARLPAPSEVVPARRLGLDVPREVLDRRIDERVRRMWAAGLVEEVRGLERAGLRRGATASRALGYRQVLEFLDGRCSQDEALAETVRATRRFARRQDRWFRADPRVTWLPYDADDLLDRALEAASDRSTST
jgi:tRNA dimethylallyltransferase